MLNKRDYETPIKKTDMQSLYPLIADVIEQGNAVKMKVTGFSMYPLLVSRRDSVLLAKAGRLHIGDIPLFRREDGSFVLHRIVGEKDGAYYVMGDYETKKEYPVYKNDIMAVAKGFYRKGKFWPCDGFRYRLYSAIWQRTVWMRPFLLRCISLYSKIKMAVLRIFK